MLSCYANKLHLLRFIACIYSSCNKASQQYSLQTWLIRNTNTVIRNIPYIGILKVIQKVKRVLMLAPTGDITTICYG